MPNAQLLTNVIPAMFIGGGMLMMMDASINIAMEPFRALVGDLLPGEQRTLGFSIQTFLIGVGAVIGSLLPYALAEWFGIGKTAAEGVVPENVIYSFYFGAIVLFLSVIWTIVKTKEYPPEKEEKTEKKESGLKEVYNDVKNMPKTMKQLGIVQFFSWFALFAMWVFTTPAIAHHIYRAPIGDTSSLAYQNAANWVGIIFGIYNAISAVYALMLPIIARKIGRKQTHSISLLIGGVALVSIFFISNPMMLIIPMIGVGIAWGSILAMPYAILAGALPAKKMGIYMGIFNFFITIPQIVNGVIGGPLIKNVFDSQAIYALVIAGGCLIIASATVVFVEDKDDIVEWKLFSTKKDIKKNNLEDEFVNSQS